MLQNEWDERYFNKALYCGLRAAALRRLAALSPHHVDAGRWLRDAQDAERWGENWWWFFQTP